MFSRFFSAKESIKENETIKKNLVRSQYGLLLISLYYFASGNPWSSLFISALAVNVEKIAAWYLESQQQKPEAAQYVAAHYSNLTQSTQLLNVGLFSELVNKVNEDVKAMEFFTSKMA